MTDPQLSPADPVTSAPRERWPLATVLVVDDEPGMRNFLQKTLQPRVGAVHCAESAEAADALRNGKLWEEMTEAEHQQYPNDVEAMVSQGVIAKHSEERLVSSDRGIAMLRRLLRDQLKAVEEGRDPAGVSFDPDAAPVQFTAGNFLVD